MSGSAGAAATKCLHTRYLAAIPVCPCLALGSISSAETRGSQAESLCREASRSLLANSGGHPPPQARKHREFWAEAVKSHFGETSSGADNSKPTPLQLQQSLQILSLYLLD